MGQTSNLGQAAHNNQWYGRMERKGTASYLAQGGEPAVLEDFGEAHVRDLGRPIARQQNVGALQIKVNHPAGQRKKFQKFQLQNFCQDGRCY